MNNNPQMVAIIVVLVLLYLALKYTKRIDAKKYNSSRIKYQEDQIHMRLINDQEPSKKVKP